MKYLIHDIISINSNVKLPIPDYFLVDKKFKRYDLTVLETELDFKKPKENLMRRVGYYFWKENSTLFIDFERMGMKLLIADLLRDARVEFSTSYRRFSSKEALEELIMGILIAKLIYKGYVCIHSGCIGLPDGSGFLITAISDLGKTSTILSLVNEEKFKFLSDERVILGEDGEAYSYPQKVKITPHTLTGKIITPLPSWKRLIGRSSYPLLFLTRFLKTGLYELKEVPREVIKDKVRVKRMFILGGYNKQKQIDRIDKGRTLSMMSFVAPETALELGKLSGTYLGLYCYLMGLDIQELARWGRKIMEKGMKGVECFELKAPDINRYVELIKELYE